MGSWLGARAGSAGVEHVLAYVAEQNPIQLSSSESEPAVSATGGTLNDGSVRADFWLNNMVTVSGTVQYEKWNFPVLDPLPAPMWRRRLNLLSDPVSGNEGNEMFGTQVGSEGKA